MGDKPQQTSSEDSRTANRRTFLATTASLSALTAGCLRLGDSGGDETNEINVLMYAAAQATATEEAVIPAFEDETGISVSLDTAPFGELLSQSLTTLQGDDAVYDVIDADMSLLPQFANEGYFEPLNEYVEESDVLSPDNFIPKVWEDTAVYGPPGDYYDLSGETRINQIPYQTNVLTLYYRTDLYDEVGLEPPETISDYEQVAEQLTNEDEGIYGMGMMAREHASVFTEWKSEYQGYRGTDSEQAGRFFEEEVIDPQSPPMGFSSTWEPVFNNEIARNTLQNYVDRVNAPYTPDGVTGWDWTDMTQNFLQGNLATAQAFSTTARSANDEGTSQVAGDVGYAVYPGIEINGEIFRAPHYGSWALAIPANSENKDAAWDFIEFQHRQEIALERARTGAQPSREDVYQTLSQGNEEIFPGSPQFFETMLEGIRVGVGRPKIVGFLEWREMMAEELNAAAIGNQDPATTLQRGEERTVDILSEQMAGHGIYD